MSKSNRKCGFKGAASEAENAPCSFIQQVWITSPPFSGVCSQASPPFRLTRPAPDVPMTRLDAILRDAQPAVVLTTTQILSDVQNQLGQGQPTVVKEWLATDEIDMSQAEAWKRPKLENDTLAFLQYTSGSTSTPKGVMVSHGNLIHNEQMIQHAFGHTEESTFVGWLPMFHDMGLIGNVLQPLYIGAHSILMSPMAFFAEAGSLAAGCFPLQGAHQRGAKLCLRPVCRQDYLRAAGYLGPAKLESCLQRRGTRASGHDGSIRVRLRRLRVSPREFLSLLWTGRGNTFCFRRR